MRRGDKLKAGDRIATLETTDAEIAVRNAEAALAQTNADLPNILYGRRPEEIAAIEANLKAAQVQQEDAEHTLNRRKDLFGRGFASQADLDTALYVVGEEGDRMATALAAFAAEKGLSVEPGPA